MTRLVPFAREDPTVGRSLLADLVNRLAVVQIELRWERVVLTAAFPRRPSVTLTKLV